MPEYLDEKIDWTHPALVAIYDELPLWSAIFGQFLFEHIRLRPNIKVLDVGCGTGFPLLELAQRLGKSCRVCGIDPWQAALNRVEQKTELLNLQNVEVRQGDATAMPFGDEEFDLIVSNLGINNFDNPAGALAECYRVAKPGAHIVLTTNLKGHMKEFYEVYASTLKELGKTEVLGKLEKHIDHRATVENATELLQKAGFKIYAIHEDSFPMRFLNGSALFRHSFIRIGFLEAWRGVVDPHEEKEVFLRLEKNLNRLAEEKGELELTIPMAYIEGEKAS